MKTSLCIALLVLFAGVGVQGHRSLLQSSVARAVSTGGAARASAMSTGNGNAVAISSADGGSSATADSTASGPGASSTTIATATGGATVEGSTDVTSVDGANVEGTTVVSGDGPGTTTAELDLKSDEDISVSIFVARVVDDEEDIEVVAKEIVVIFGERTNAKIVAALKEGFAGDELSVALFVRVLELFFEGGDCNDDIRPVFDGVERDFIVYALPEIVTTCIYVPCSEVESAEFCCGEAQLEQEFCNCSGDSCAFQQPETPNPFVPYWDCQECGAEIDFCVCH